MASSSSSSVAASRVQKRSRASASQALARSMLSQKPVLKGVDTFLGFAGGTYIDGATDNTGAFSLALASQGSASYNRVGKRIKLHSLRCRFNIEGQYFYNADSDYNYTTTSVRYVVVWDRSPNGSAIPSWETVFGITDSQGTQTSIMLAPVSYLNTGRFHVLRDEIVTIQPNFPFLTDTVNEYRSITHTVDFYQSLKGLTSVFSADSSPATNSDVSTGALYIYFRRIASSSSTWDDCRVWLPSGFSRVRFSD